MNGILCINKPQGFTSFDVAAKLRGMLKTKKIGHAGTLDPMATGVLPVFVGNATKACDIMPDSSKAYRASFRLGEQSDTQDSTGTILKTAEVNCTAADIEALLPKFRGEIMQIPPMYSAVSVNGKRLYELARQGIEVERESRNVTIYSLELLNFDEETQSGTLKVACSKGTYIRTLCEDIGNYLGTGGTLGTELFSRLVGIISRRFRRESFVFQAVFHAVLYKGIYNCENRHAEYHTRKAEKPRHHRNGNDDPYRLQTDGGAYQFRSDIVSVQLLYEEYQNTEPQRFYRADNEYDKRARYGTDKRTEKRDDVCHAHDKAYQRVIRHSQQSHADEADNSDDEGIEDFRGNKSAEALIRHGYVFHKRLIFLFAHAGAGNLFGLCAEAFLREKEINRHDDTDK